MGIGKRRLRRVQHVVQQYSDGLVWRGQSEIGKGARRQVEVERLLRCATGSPVVHIEEVDRLDHSILHHFEVILFQAFHGIALGICHDDIHDHAPNLYFELVGFRLRVRSIRCCGRYW